jgi:hypothetical protein
MDESGARKFSQAELSGSWSASLQVEAAGNSVQPAGWLMLKPYRSET